jgi:hypothetical protein
MYMSAPEEYGFRDSRIREMKPSSGFPEAVQQAEPHPRAFGSPLPVGSGFGSGSPPDGDMQRAVAATPPGRGLVNTQAMAPIDVPSGIQRAVNAIRSALPFVQRILPLLDGNIGTAVSNFVTPHSHSHPPQPPVDLAPLEQGLSRLQTNHRELLDQVAEQNTSLKRVEDQLEMVREATDRNTLEQQELLEDLKGVANKVNAFALIAFTLLGISVLINVILFLHIRRVLP